jgi:hypothetical protein
MCSWFNRNSITISTLPVCFSALLFCTPLFADYELIIKQVNLLEDDFKALSADFYKASSLLVDKQLQTIVDIDELYAEVYRLIDNQQSTMAVRLLYLNVDTIEANLEHQAVFTFTELLLEKNNWSFANRLFRSIKDEGDRSLLAAMQFIFAKYHAERLQWPQVNKLLNGVAGQLSADSAAYANLLNGSALQHMKKHRWAIENYNKVPDSSTYYAYAQLNSAIANIRQGWWTDAQTTINDLIKHTDKDNSDELTNRLYLVLGYALLQKEYYRDARNAFRHIGLNSRYTNRALLGIGLTATSQGDFIGGLNALSILKDKKTCDLSVDESYLLVPYVYEKLQQELTVTASYTEAMAYYQQRIKKLDNMANQSADFLNTQYNENTASLIIDNTSLAYGQQYPESFIKNYRTLIDYLSVTKDLKMKSQIEALITKHDAVFQEIIRDLLQQRIEYLKSYLNQSRYGLARLYDKSNEAAH